MEINVNITLSASPALLAALASLAGAAVQAAPAQPQEPTKPAKKAASKPAEPKPAPAQVEDKKEEPGVEEQPKEEPKREEQKNPMTLMTFCDVVRPFNQVLGPDKMRELIAEFGGERLLKTVPEDRWPEFIDRAKELAEGGAA